MEALNGGYSVNVQCYPCTAFLAAGEEGFIYAWRSCALAHRPHRKSRRLPIRTALRARPQRVEQPVTRTRLSFRPPALSRDSLMRIQDANIHRPEVKCATPRASVRLAKVDSTACVARSLAALSEVNVAKLLTKRRTSSQPVSRIILAVSLLARIVPI
jgi:hypothetical protein